MVMTVYHRVGTINDLLCTRYAAGVKRWVPIPFWELVPWQLVYQGGASSLLSSIHRGKEFHFHFAWHYILSGSLSMLRPKGEDLWLQNLI